MTDPQHHLSDDDLMRLLASALDEAEPVPDDALHAAYGAIEIAALTEELAVLMFDSASTGGELVGMRATETETRLLTFTNDHVTIDLELHADRRTIVGQIAPPCDGVLVVESVDEGSSEVATDEFGRFRVVAPSGPIRLRVTGVVVTPWITR